MNFQCQKCQTRYTIADEKIRGKVLKVRCRSCAALITVRDPAASGAFSSTRGGGYGASDSQVARAPDERLGDLASKPATGAGPPPSARASGVPALSGAGRAPAAAASGGLRAVGKRIAKPLPGGLAEGEGSWSGGGGAGVAALEGRVDPRAVATKHGAAHSAAAGMASGVGAPVRRTTTAPPPIPAPRPAPSPRAAPDPFAAARRHQWFVSVSAGELGPIGFQELQDRIASGEADRYCYAWREGLGDWQLLGDMQDLSPLFGGSNGASAGGPGVRPADPLSRRATALAAPLGGGLPHEGGDDEEFQADRTVVVDPAGLQDLLSKMPVPEEDVAEEELVEDDPDGLGDLVSLASQARSAPAPAFAPSGGVSARAPAGGPSGRVTTSIPPPPGLGSGPVSARAPAAGPSGRVSTTIPPPPGVSGRVATVSPMPGPSGSMAPPPPHAGPPRPFAAGLEPSGASLDLVIGEPALAAPVAARTASSVALPMSESSIEAAPVIAVSEARKRTALWAALFGVLGAAAAATVVVLLLGDGLTGESAEDDDRIARIDDRKKPEKTDDGKTAAPEPDETAAAVTAAPDTAGGSAMVFDPAVVEGDKRPATGDVRPRTGTPRPATADPKLAASMSSYAAIYGSTGKTDIGGPTLKTGAPAAPKRTTIGDAEISGTVSKNVRAIKLCYERALKRGEGEAGGKARVTVTVRGTGDVTKVAVAPPYAGGFFGGCLKDTIGRWRFPEFSGDPVTFEWPIVLESGS